MNSPWYGRIIGHSEGCLDLGSPGSERETDRSLACGLRIGVQVVVARYPGTALEEGLDFDLEIETGTNGKASR